MSRTLLALAILIAPLDARAQPTVRVRAEARIELRVERAPGAVTLRGALRDDLGQPLGDREVQLRVHQVTGAPLHEALARTDDRGRFAAPFPLEPGSYRIDAIWAGDDGHSPIETSQPLDLTRAPVRLEVNIADDRLDLDRPVHEIAVRVRSAEGGAGLEIELRDERERALALATTASDGRARFVVESARLGPPGAGRLIARTRGDRRRSAAQAEVPIIRYRQPSLTLEIPDRRVQAGETIFLAGRLQDKSGPLARRAVGLFAGDEHLETVLTDDAGRFARTIALEPESGASEIVLMARFASDAPWRPPAVSEGITITFEGHGSTPWWWLVAPMLAFATAIGLISRRRRPTSGAPLEADFSSHGITPASMVPGAQTLREIGGIVRDAESNRPITQARVVLTRSGELLETTCDDEGRFRFAEVGGDRWQLTVRAPGYEVCSVDVRLPHRGSWSRATVRLRSLRDVALARYLPAAQALAPGRKWWAFWTPRELAAKAPTRSDDLTRLTEAVERAAYSRSLPDEADIAEITERAARVARELGRD